MLEYYYNMLSEFETIHKFNDPLATITLALHEFFKESNFNIGVIYVKFFVFSYFRGHNTFIVISMVYTFYNLAKSPLVNYPDDLIAVSQLLAYFRFVVAFFVSDLILILPSHFSNSVNFFENSQFYFFKFGQLRSEKF